MNDMRWKQRFDNFEKALQHLDTALEVEHPDILQKAGIIQFFEMTFELSWKLLKDYLESQGFADIQSPRAAIKKAYEVTLIEDGHQWLQMLENRNLTTYAFDEETANEVVEAIHTRCHPLLKGLYQKIKAEL